MMAHRGRDRHDGAVKDYVFVKHDREVAIHPELAT